MFMRHGKHSGGQLTYEGKARVRAAATRVAAELDKMGKCQGGLVVTHIEPPLAERTSEAFHTANLVHEEIARSFNHCCENTTGQPVGRLGESASAYAERTQARHRVEVVVDAIKKHTAAQLLVVGNDPFLSWVLRGCRESFASKMYRLPLFGCIDQIESNSCQSTRNL